MHAEVVWIAEVEWYESQAMLDSSVASRGV